METIKPDLDAEYYLIHTNDGKIIEGYGRDTEHGISIHFKTCRDFIPYTAMSKARIYKRCPWGHISGADVASVVPGKA